MAESADYRKRAQECMEMAKTARTPAHRTMLQHIAGTWLRLAGESEDAALTSAVPKLRSAAGDDVMRTASKQGLS